jgi:hypothetical protein
LPIQIDPGGGKVWAEWFLTKTTTFCLELGREIWGCIWCEICERAILLDILNVYRQIHYQQKTCSIKRSTLPQLTKMILLNLSERKYSDFVHTPDLFFDASQTFRKPSKLYFSLSSTFGFLLRLNGRTATIELWIKLHFLTLPESERAFCVREWAFWSSYRCPKPHSRRNSGLCFGAFETIRRSQCFSLWCCYKTSCFSREW